MFNLRSILVRKTRARLRRLVRAHLWLMSNGREAAAHLETARVLLLHRLSIPSWGALGIVPEDYIDHVETVVRQRIGTKVLGSRLMPELMAGRHQRSLELNLPLPASWRSHLIADGFRVSAWRSRISWLVMQIGFLGGAFIRAGRLIRDRECGPATPADGYAVFVNAPRQALPRTPHAYGDAFGMVRWYMESPMRPPEETAAWVITPSLEDQWQAHGFDVTTGPFPSLGSLRRRLRFILAAARILIVGTVASGLGAWWIPPLLGEALLLAYIRCLNSSELARTYLFNNSEYILRPLWTYHAQACGSRVIMVFYSTNMQRLMWSDGTISPVFPGYEIMSWPEYAVWNKEQQQFLIEIGHADAKYHLCGRIDIEDSGDALPVLPKNSVIVFDVAPFRPSALARIGMAPPYYSASMAKQFITDVEAAISRAGLVMIQKSKRDAGTSLDTQYMRLLTDMSADGRMIAAPSSVSVNRLAYRAIAAITMPFSSAAIAAHSLGIASVYYDPTGQAAAFVRAQTDSIEVISDVDSLVTWLVCTKTARLSPCGVEMPPDI